MAESEFLRVDGKATTLVLSAAVGALPRIVYWGARLGDSTAPDMLAALLAPQFAMGGPTEPQLLSLSCETGLGLMVPPGLEVSRGGALLDLRLTVTAVEQTGARIEIHCADITNDVLAIYTIELDERSDVAAISFSLNNTAAEDLSVITAAACTLPVPTGLDEIISFSGRWAGEFCTERTPLSRHGFISENRRGRTSHDRFPGLILCAPQTQETSGPCFGLHLGWSGNHRMRVEALEDGRRLMQAGELLLPGETVLARGERYTSPTLYASWSDGGLSALSHSFHTFVRTRLTDGRTQTKPRPIHCNTWEAMYFDQSPQKVIAMADAASALGIERFVLDDGWFKGRRSDTAGLGDWTVDTDIYPDGLDPVIAHVTGLGMEFGLWVEPEMVNPDSDLYRAHPDWALSAPHAPDVPFRNQLVLNLTRPDVAEHIFNQIDALLSQHDISYLKWDMNRDLSHPFAGGDRPLASTQTRAVYALIDRLRAAHPSVEIETCASGGGRADYGILARTDRIWTSDSNDALDRQTIQRGASHFFPLEILGAHIGPKVCHITGRTSRAEFRAATAMFGTMGIEANLLALSEKDSAVIKSAFALYKRYRSLLHSGRLIRLDRPAYETAQIVVAEDQSEALLSYALLASMPDRLPGILKLAGLDPESIYTVKLVWPTPPRTPWPHHLETSQLASDGLIVTGEALMAAGLQLPQTFPETALFFHISQP